MDDGETCVDCGRIAPPTNTNYTLISSTGWRLSRELDSTGKHIAAWRCPVCWNQRKVKPASAPKIGVRPNASTRK